MLFSPVQNHRIQRADQPKESLLRLRMQWRDGVTAEINGRIEERIHSLSLHSLSLYGECN